MVRGIVTQENLHHGNGAGIDQILMPGQAKA
jgi:hypothetical protein